MKRIAYVLVFIVLTCHNLYAGDLIVDGNLGVGTTTALDKLTVNDGTDENLVIGDSSTGVIRISSQNNAGNAWKPLQFDASVYYLTSGNVGIGTTNPSNSLEVYAGASTSQILWGQNIRNNGNANLTGYGSGLKFKISSEGGIEANKWVGIAGVAGNGYANRTDMAFYVNPSAASAPVERMRIRGDGYVGIGESNPSYPLHVEGNIYSSAGVIATTLWSSDSVRKTIASSPLYFRNSAGTPEMVVDGSGNVGIGTPVANAKLDVRGGGVIDSTGTGATMRIADALFMDGDELSVTGSDFYIGNSANSFKNLHLGNNLNIKSDGYVGIGTPDPSAKLQVVGDLDLGPSAPIGNQYGTLSIKSNYIGGGTYGGIWLEAANSPNALSIGHAGPYAYLNSANGSVPLFINEYGGNVVIGGGGSQTGYMLSVYGSVWSPYGYWSGSDAKLKKNVQPLSSALSKVLKLNGVSYEWKEDYYKGKGSSDGEEVLKNREVPKGRHIGVIAQELEKVLPELVSEDSEGTKAVAYMELIPVLIEAMKEQQKQIEQLQNKVAELSKTK